MVLGMSGTEKFSRRPVLRGNSIPVPGNSTGQRTWRPRLSNGGCGGGRMKHGFKSFPQMTSALRSSFATEDGQKTADGAGRRRLICVNRRKRRAKKFLNHG